MIHDKAGNSIVRMVQAPFAATAQDALVNKEWRAQVVEETNVLQYTGGLPSVVCTSAGHTTRLIFDLVTSPTSVPPESGNDAYGRDSKPISPKSTATSFRLASRQDASIISSDNSNINLRVSRAAAAGLRQRDGMGGSVAGAHLAETADAYGLASEWFVKITVDGVVVNTSLESVSTQGLAVPLEGWEGTVVFEICVLEKRVEGPGENRPVDPNVCVAEGVLIVELFSAETQIVQRRASREMVLPSSALPGGLDEGLSSTEPTTRVVFIISLEVVDGYKLSTLHLMKHLPGNFQASALDLTCACKGLLKRKIACFHC